MISELTRVVKGVNSAVESVCVSHYAQAGLSMPSNCLTIGVRLCCGAVPIPSKDAKAFSSEPRERQRAAEYMSVPNVWSPPGLVVRLSM